MLERCSRSKGSKKRQAMKRSIRKTLCLPCILFPFLYICSISTRLLMAGKERNSQAARETQGETCKADDPCSSQVAESMAQRSSFADLGCPLHKP